MLYPNKPEVAIEKRLEFCGDRPSKWQIYLKDTLKKEQYWNTIQFR